nr:hypothetical protein KVC08_04715 [Helicobacter pylori]
MRQEHETATSFNELKAITQAIMLKKGAPTNATNQESEPTQEANNANAHTQEPTQARAQASENAHASERTQRTGSKPKATTQTKKQHLNPTKRAFSERQITAFRDHSQGRANTSLTTHQSKGGNNEA